MSKRTEFVYFGVMLDAARRAASKGAGVTKEQYDADDTLQLALTYLVQNVGEAATKVPPDARALHPEIDWTAIAGMRHRLVHDYLNVDVEKVWHALHNDIPELIRVLAAFTPPEPPSG